MCARSSEKVPKVNVEERCSPVPAQEPGDLVLSPEKDKTLPRDYLTCYALSIS